MLRRPFVLPLLVLCAVVALFLFTARTSSQSTNHSLFLNGTTTYVGVPYNTSLELTGSLTMEAWVKTNSSAEQVIIERGNWASAQYSYDLVLSGGKARADIYQNSGSYGYVVGATTITTNVWHHIAAVYTGSQLKIYLDGVLDGSNSCAYAPQSNTAGVRIGRGTNIYYPNNFNGRIDEVRVSNGVVYNSTFTPAAHLSATSDTRGLWKFDSSTNNDFSGNGNDGTTQADVTYSTDVPVGPNVSPTISLTDPQNNSYFTTGSNVVIDATASDSDGQIAKVEFFQGSTLLGTDTVAPYTFYWNNVAAGSYSITAMATDDLGATTTTSPITITVTQPNQYNSVLLNGTTSYVSVPYNASLNLTGALTMEAWVKTNSSAEQVVIERGNWSNAEYSYDLVLSGGKARADIYQTSGSYGYVSGATTITTNVWHHIAAVYTGSQLKVYLDGVLDGTNTCNFTPQTNSAGVRIGRGSNIYYPNNFNGRIDEVRISDGNVYTANFTPGAHLSATSDTRGLWKFDGSTSNDSSTNGNNGTLQEGAVYDPDVPSDTTGSQRPVALAGSSYSGQVGQPVQFTGSNSFDPDGTITAYHWNFGDGTAANTANPSHTYTSAGSYTATLTVTDNGNLMSSSTTGVNIAGSSVARLDPRNRTGGGGEDPLSRNFNWVLPILSLAGRAGMDLSLTLSYNSLIWTRNGSYISFDEDRGFPSPGFRLGFPTIQNPYFNTEVGKVAYLLIGPDGTRVELRQVGSSTLYESADSAHLLFDSSTLILRSTDGTQLFYTASVDGYSCNKVKDRNGNFLTINYDAGNLSSIIDTLGRQINFAYSNGYLQKIEQQWNINGSTATHTWATFDYANITIQTQFTGVSLYGPTNGTSLKMLSRVTLDDNSDTPANNSHFDFDYTSWGQVWKISHYAADNELLNYRSYDLPQSNSVSKSDCPRFTERRDWGKFANGDVNGTPVSTEETVTTFAEPWTETWTMPTGGEVTGTVAQVGTKLDASTYVNYDKIYFIGSTSTAGWQRGLPALVRTYDQNNVLQRQAVTLWEQDDETKSYPLNPRVKETWVLDSANQKRVKTEYSSFSLPNSLSIKLPTKVLEYDTDASSVVRSTWIDYKMSTAYKNSYVLGLVSEKILKAGSNGSYLSWMTYDYDNGSIIGSDAPTQHDNANYGSSFNEGRGNLTLSKRFDVTNGNFTQSTIAYNNSGSAVSTKDHLDHETLVSYVDAFSDKTGTATYAYPTSVTDPMDAIAKSTYDFDFGAITSTQGTAPHVSTYAAGVTQYLEYYPYGALKKVTNSVNSAYVRYEYPTDQLVVNTFTTIEAGKGEAKSFVFTDGFGRKIGTASEHQTASNFKFSGQRFKYDAVGRVIETSNPTETTAEGAPFNWIATGDDASGWVFTTQTYDWKGRPLVTINPSLTANPLDTTTRTIEYAGCGCAGGEVVTLTDEGTVVNGVVKTRQQKVYSDLFGRAVKTEVYNFEGTGTGGARALYSTSVTNYNLRDQVTLSRVFSGAAPSDQSDLTCPTNTCRRTEMTYDGFGRVKTSHEPVQQPETNNTGSSDHTTFYYNGDDTVDYAIDARGVVKQFTYNARHQVTGLSYNLTLIPSAYNHVASTPSATFEYDLAGNRTQMNDGTGTTSYHYNALNQLDSETRQFSGPLSGNSYTLSYDYNLAGELQQMEDYAGTITTYEHNKVGQLTKVSGNLIPSFSDDYAIGFLYRAWGGLKQVNYTNSTSQSVRYNRRLLPVSATLSNVRTNTMSQHGDMSWTYNYYPDGTQKQLLDQNDGRFDRLMEYDFAGRPKEAYSGREARGQAASSPADSPFRQTYSYNAFDDPVSKNGRFWRTTQTGDEPCIPRSSTDGCDAEGNVLSTSYGDQIYDAENRQVHHVNWRYMVGPEIDEEPQSAFEIDQTYDALGRPARRDETRRRVELLNGGPTMHIATSVTTTYCIYSSVLGGAKAIELDDQGQKLFTYVYANGSQLGKFQHGSGGTFTWHQSNPGSNSWVESLEGGYATRKEMDPDGAEVGEDDPLSQVLQQPTYESWKDEQPLYIEGGDPFDYVEGYSMNGLPMTKGQLAREMNRLGGLAGLALAISRVGTRTYKGRVGDLIELDVHTRADLDAIPDKTLEKYFAYRDNYGFVFGPSGAGPTWQPQGNQSADQLPPQNTTANPIEFTSPASVDCKIAVAFSGSYDQYLPNGPGILRLSAGNAYGVGFTVYGSVVSGGIGHIMDMSNQKNPNGAWTIEQWTSAYIKQDGVVTLNGGAATPDIKYGTPYEINGNDFRWYDHPGLQVINQFDSKERPRGVKEYDGRFDIAVKVRNGAKQCEVKFSLVSKFSKGAWSYSWHQVK